MRAVSRKRAALLRIYAKKRIEFLAEHPRCAVGDDHLATDVHHKAGRGALLLDESLWLPLCREHHRFITDNPAWAVEHGYSVLRVGRAS